MSALSRHSSSAGVLSWSALITLAIHLVPLQAQGQGKGKSVPRPELVVTVDASTKPPSFQLSLVNRSSATLRVFHDSMIQPAAVQLSDVMGRLVPPVDTRETMKFDSTPKKSALRELSPGASLAIAEGTWSEEGSGTWRLRVGPFLYDGLRRGRFTARATWTSVIDSVWDSDSEAMILALGVWRGRLRSRQFTIRIE